MGEAKGNCYKLGQKLQVVVADANTMMRTIDFVLPEDAVAFGLDAAPEDIGQYQAE